MQAVCKPFEVQVLLSIDDWSQQSSTLSDRLVSWPSSKTRRRTNTTEGPAGQNPSTTAWQEGPVLSAVLGPLTASLRCDQILSMLHTAESITAELTAYRQHLCYRPSNTAESQGAEATLLGVSLEIAESCFVAVGDERTDLQLAKSSYFAAPSGGPVQVLVGAPCIRVGLLSGLDSGPDPAGIFASMLSPLAWALPNAGFFVPVTDVSVTQAGQCAPCTGKLVSGMGTALPTPREAERGQNLCPGAPDCRTTLPPEASVLCTLHEIQMEVKLPAASSGQREQEGQSPAPPPLQMFLAIATAEAKPAVSPEEYLAFSLLSLALQSPFRASRDQHGEDSPDTAMGVHFQFALSTFHATLQSSAPADSPGMEYPFSLHADSIVINYERWAKQVCFCWQRPQATRCNAASLPLASFLLLPHVGMDPDDDMGNATELSLC